MTKNFSYITLLLLILLPAISSCIKDNEQDYSEWEQKNLDFVASAQTERNSDGTLKYIRMAPEWAPEAFILVKWENNRSLTEKNLRPLSNSVVNVKYDLEDIDGNKIDNSYSSTTYGDSIYQSRPNQNILGFWNCVTNMHVGDSVTCIMPYFSAYGSVPNGKVKPYSTLIYHIKLVSIPAYQIPFQ